MNRIQPAMATERYKSYTIAAPRSSHYRPAGCEESGCLDYRNGWVTTVDESTDLGARQAHYVRHDRSRKHGEEKLPSGMTAFTFPAGQRCFREHEIRTSRPEIYIERGGDWRGNPRGDRRVHRGPDDWLDSFANHQGHLADVFRKG